MLENELTNIEVLIMRCVWDSEEELGLSQLTAAVNERFDKDWKLQTISTYLAHLVRKGFLSMRRKGKVFLYHAEVSEDSYRNQQVKEVISYWLDSGTPKEFLESVCYDGISTEEKEMLKNSWNPAKKKDCFAMNR